MKLLILSNKDQVKMSVEVPCPIPLIMRKGTHLCVILPYFDSKTMTMSFWLASLQKNWIGCLTDRGLTHLNRRSFLL